jgi:hypothetical protein
MDTINKIGKLVEKAQNQQTPVLFVSERVMQRIKSRHNHVASFFAFDMFALASAVAASVLLFIGIQSWFYITNPLARLYAPLSGISLW